MKTAFQPAPFTETSITCILYLPMIYRILRKIYRQFSCQTDSNHWDYTYDLIYNRKTQNIYSSMHSENVPLFLEQSSEKETTNLVNEQ